MESDSLAVPTIGITGATGRIGGRVARRLATKGVHQRLLVRDVTYVDETLKEARAARASYGAPDWEVDGWISTYTAIAAGKHEQMTHDVEMLIGRPGTPLREVLGGLSR